MGPTGFEPAPQQRHRRRAGVANQTMSGLDFVVRSGVPPVGDDGPHGRIGGRPAERRVDYAGVRFDVADDEGPVATLHLSAAEL